MGYGSKKKKPLPSIAWLQPRVARAHAISLAMLVLLLLLLAYWNIFLVDNYTQTTIAMMVYEFLPLLLVAPGMFKGSAYVYSWACFAILLHFLQGIWMLMEPHKQLIGVAETLLTVGLFISATYYIRWRHQLTRRENGEE